ncbi:MAG: hypothetical protein IKZ88_04960 [Neisseriaceae bacterium]|nr:hypothetical protein [Neisseriaceae bacterium]
MENLRLTKNGKEYARMLDRSTTQFKLKNLRELEQSYNQDLDRYCFMVVCLFLGQVCHSVELHSIGLVFSFMAVVSFLRAVFKVNDNLLWAERQIQQENARLRRNLHFQTQYLIQNDRFMLKYQHYQGSNKRLTRVERCGLFFWQAKNAKNEKQQSKMSETQY